MISSKKKRNFSSIQLKACEVDYSYRSLVNTSIIYCTMPNQMKLSLDLCTVFRLENIGQGFYHQEIILANSPQFNNAYPAYFASLMGIYSRAVVDRCTIQLLVNNETALTFISWAACWQAGIDFAIPIDAAGFHRMKSNPESLWGSLSEQVSGHDQFKISQSVDVREFTGFSTIPQSYEITSNRNGAILLPLPIGDSPVWSIVVVNDYPLPLPPFTIGYDIKATFEITFSSLHAPYTDGNIPVPN